MKDNIYIFYMCREGSLEQPEKLSVFILRLPRGLLKRAARN